MKKKETSDKKMSTATKQILVLAVALVLLIAGTYAWLSLTMTGTKTNILRAGKLSLVLNDKIGEGILLEKAVPMTTNEGMKTKEYTFTLKNEGATALNYTIYLDDIAIEDSKVRMKDQHVRYRLVKDDTELTNLLSNLTNRALDKGEIEGNTTNTYRLQVWIDSEANNEVMKTVFHAKLRIVAQQENS